MSLRSVIRFNGKLGLAINQLYQHNMPTAKQLNYAEHMLGRRVANLTLLQKSPVKR